MSFRTLLKRLMFGTNPDRRRPGVSRAKTWRLAVEPLEDRSLPSTFTVMNLADSGDGSLRAAIAAAEANAGADVIDFANPPHGTIALTTGELLVTDDLTINGPGANQLTVSGNDASRIFRVVGGADASTAISVSLSGLTISHGRADDSGGGIFNSGFSALTLTGVVLSDNVAVGLAGPNAAGGAVHSFGAGARLSVVDSRIVGNTADGRNVLRGVGGGLDVQGGSLNVVNSTIADNQAFGGVVGLGGGIRLFFATATITDSVIRDNRVGGPDVGEAFGGGVNVRFSSLVVNTSELIGNLALGGDGGLGQAGGGAIENVLGSVAIFDSMLVNNRAIAGNGGANAGDDVSVGTAWGGAIINGGLLEIVGSTLRGNQAIGGNHGTHDNAPATADVGAAHGGAIFTAGGAEALITDSLITHNSAIGGHGNTGSGPVAFVGTATGGGIDNSLDLALFGDDPAPPRLTVRTSTIAHNDAIGGDGNTGLGDVVFAGAGLGGGIANYLGGITDITDSVLHHNRAVGGAGNTVSGGSEPADLGAGGGIFNALGNFVTTVGVGGPSIVNVAGITLANNLALGGGNGGNGYGGGAYNDATSSLALDASSVTRNHANGGDGRAGGEGEGLGGGIYNLGDLFADLDSLIEANHASTDFDDMFEV
jgi:hypothetical protein